MATTLQMALNESGAVIDEGGTTPTHFGDPVAELRAALRSCVLADRSALTRLRGTGPDLLDLLQRLSTGDVGKLSAGDGTATVLTTAKGRIVERLFVSQTAERGVLLVGSTDAGTRVVEHLARFTFAEQIGLTDIGASTRQLALVGPQAAAVLETAGFARPTPFGAVAATLETTKIDILGHDGLSPDGFLLVVPSGEAGDLWQRLAEIVAQLGGSPAGDQPLLAHRILRGLPAGGFELTEDHNPLEAGLLDAISFDKGCYVGQEVVARLNTYKKVSRKLVGLELSGPLEPSTANPALYAEQVEIGKLTSYVVPPGQTKPIALAYVKHKNLDADAALHVGTPDSGVTARQMELPFDSRLY